MSREDTARVFKAFCDENRLEIIELLKKGEMCANDILKNVGIVQSTLSHHMKMLCESGIISQRKSGKMTLYSISSDGIDMASELLDAYRGAPAPKTNVKKTEPVKEAVRKPAKETIDTADEDDELNWSKMVTFID